MKIELQSTTSSKLQTYELRRCESVAESYFELISLFEMYEILRAEIMSTIEILLVDAILFLENYSNRSFCRIVKSPYMIDECLLGTSDIR